MVGLSKFSYDAFDRGASVFKELFWRVVQQSLFHLECFKGYGLKLRILRFFGAKLDAGVVFKPKAKITFP